jgi:hypothetical protein
MKWILILPWLLAQLTGPQAKIGTGTATFLIYSPGIITIAADSRTTLFIGAPNDTECKISAFGNNYAFAMAGITFQYDGQTPHDIANQVWEANLNETDATKLVLAVAEKWTKRMEELYGPLETSVFRKIRSFGGEMLTTAYFIATNKAGQMAAASSEIKFDGKVFDLTSKVQITHDIEAVQPYQWYSAGLREITDEHMKQTSDRAREYMTAFMAQIIVLPPSERDAKLAAELIKLSILLHPHKEMLAFPIDVLQLKRSIGVNWVSVKPNCR